MIILIIILRKTIQLVSVITHLLFSNARDNIYYQLQGCDISLTTNCYLYLHKSVIQLFKPTYTYDYYVIGLEGRCERLIFYDSCTKIFYLCAFGSLAITLYCFNSSVIRKFLPASSWPSTISRQNVAQHSIFSASLSGSSALQWNEKFTHKSKQNITIDSIHLCFSRHINLCNRHLQ